jgi:hypothetical protein
VNPFYIMAEIGYEIWQNDSFESASAGAVQQPNCRNPSVQQNMDRTGFKSLPPSDERLHDLELGVSLHR